MFWNNKKKNYRSQVKTLLSTMGIPDFDSIGILAIYDQIDIGYHNKFTEHETALTFAYSCVPKLAQQDMSGAIVFYEKTAKRQDEWLDSGLITQDVVGRFKELTLIHLDFKQVYSIGQEVKIIDGEWQDVNGAIVIDIEHKKNLLKLCVLKNFFVPIGTVIKVKFSQVEKTGRTFNFSLSGNSTVELIDEITTRISHKSWL